MVAPIVSLYFIISSPVNSFHSPSPHQIHRTAEQNSDECVKKIYETIKQSCTVPRETSAGQKKKVEKLAAAHKQQMLEYKKRLKEKKADRRGTR